MSVGMAKYIIRIPYRHEFYTKVFVGGMKLEIVPILEPPMMAARRTITPRNAQRLSLC